MSMPEHYDISKYIDLTLNKTEIGPNETDFIISPHLLFHMTISNNSEYMVEFDRLFYNVKFKLPLKNREEEDFIVIGKGYNIVKDTLSGRQKREVTMAIELPHTKVIAINKTLGVAKTIEAVLMIYAYFTRYPNVYQALPLFAPPNIRAWSEITDFPPIGWVTKEFEFKIPLDEWEAFVEKVKKTV